MEVVRSRSGDLGFRHFRRSRHGGTLWPGCGPGRAGRHRVLLRSVLLQADAVHRLLPDPGVLRLLLPQADAVYKSLSCMRLLRSLLLQADAGSLL